MEEHKFAIGELVTTRVELAEADLGKSPRPYQVLEQRRQTCPGGEQLHYLLHVGDRQILFLEIELVNWYSDETKAAFARARDENDEHARRRWSAAKENVTQRAEQAAQAEQAKLRRAQEAGE